MVRYHYVDVLLSQKEGHFYAGCTQNLLNRLEQRVGCANFVFAHAEIWKDTVLERYEYDAYGNPTIWNADFTTERANSNYGNPYLFTGRRTDILDSGSLKIQYNRNRYYDYYTGRWLSHDPLGITPNPQQPNKFDVFTQYNDVLSLYRYVRSNPAIDLDPHGLVAWPPDPAEPPDPPPSPSPSPPPGPEPLSLDCPDGGCPSGWLDPLPSTGRSDDWSAVQAQWHFHFGGGADVEFSHSSTFAWRCSVPTPATSGISGSLYFLSKKLERKAKTIGTHLQPCRCASFSSFGISPEGYRYGGDFNWIMTLSKGNNDDMSILYHSPKCCLKRICRDGAYKGKLVCRIRWDLWDLFSWRLSPAIHRIGNDYWQIVHFDKNLNIEIDL